MKPVDSLARFTETPLAGLSAVIADDEAMTVLHLKRVLTREGLRVVGAAPSGEQAVEIVLRERPDVVLMDVALSGMDGWEASRRILAVYRPCIIMLTGQPQELIELQMGAVGVCGCVTKPYAREELVQALRLFMGYHAVVTVRDRTGVQ